MADYYAIAGLASQQIGGHSGLIKLAAICKTSRRILDVGCGEGSRLNTLLSSGQAGWGIDISPQAIKLAKAQYPRHHFQVGSAAHLPYPDNYFDLVYSAFTLEHVSSPETVITEMFRVTRPGGQVVILCPNYGAPNRRSPVSVTPRFPKLILGFWHDFFPRPGLNWQPVVPKKTYNRIDDDTTVEPYLHSLLLYLSPHSKIQLASSVWDQEAPSLNPRKFLIRLLGQLNIFPFKYWGPQIFVIAVK